MLQDNVFERGDLAFRGEKSPEAVPALARESDVRSPAQKVTAREPSRIDPVAKTPAPVDVEKTSGDSIAPSRNSFLSRRPVISALGAVLLASVLGGGYLYIDSASRFQSTDDAFIAAAVTDFP